MSRFILRPISQRIAKGRLFPGNIVGCGCKCHTKNRIRTVSLHHSALLDCDFDSDSSTSRSRKRHQQTIHFNSYRDACLFKPSSLPRLGTPLTLNQKYDHLLQTSYTSSICDITATFSNCTTVSSFHTSAWWHKEESKVEKSVKALKEKAEQLEKEEQEKGKDTAVYREEPVVVVPVKKSLWQRFVAELKHYYHGFRLLFIDIKICSRLLWNVLHGKTLTRRERRQLVRTTADMFRLVPFLVFLLVPFMEFLLPVAVKLFPNMLPSTFTEENKILEKRKKNLKLKLEMAKFLQDTIHETALQKRKKKGNAAEEFSLFVEKIRSQGIRPTTKEILKFAKLFEDEITLDNLSRQQLQAVCRVLNIQPIGIDALLRFQLDMKLRQLKADDKMIVKEGVDSLSVAELQAANRARGMRALGVSNERLREQLQQWLTLHLDEHIPTSLLLLSRALYLPETLSAEEQLTVTITKLTETAPAATDEVKLKAAELAGEKVDNKTRLEVIKKEEDIIAAETRDRQQEEALEEQARQIQEEREAAEAVAGQSSVDLKEMVRDDAVVIEPVKAEELVDKAPQLAGLAGEEIQQKEEKKAEEDDTISAKDLEEIESALEEIAEQKHISIEQEELMDLKEEVNEYKEDLEDLKEMMLMGGKPQDQLVESKAARRLMKRVDRLIRQSDSVIGELTAEKQLHQEDIESIQDELKRSADLKSEEKQEAVEEVMAKISQSKDKIVNIDEMLAAMKRLQKVPNEAKLQRIVDVLDEDHDGNININLALRVVEELGQENVKLSKVQVAEMINLLKAEMELEEEEKLKEKVEKETKEQLKQSDNSN